MSTKPAAEISAPAPQAVPMAPPRSLIASRFQNSEHARTVWRVVAEEGTTLDDVRKPIFWAHVAHTMARFDKIEVLADDETWYAELMVRDCGRGFASTVVLSHIEFEANEADKPTSTEGFEIGWKGVKRRFVVIREADRTLVKEELPNKAAAMAWVQEFVRAGGN